MARLWPAQRPSVGLVPVEAVSFGCVPPREPWKAVLLLMLFCNLGLVEQPVVLEKGLRVCLFGNERPSPRQEVVGIEENGGVLVLHGRGSSQ